jgi:uncharacterized repeat protein (TIGR01451 family)
MRGSFGSFSLALACAGAALFFVSAAGAANPSASLDQCANDPAPSSHLDGCNSSATQWVNGNLGSSKAVYLEGDSIPYRLTFSNLSTSGTHNVKIEWDTTKSSKHAIDYLTTFNQTVANANPCLGVTGCSGFSTFAIPADPQVTGAGVTPIAGNFRLYGGTITAVSAYSYSTGTGFTGDKSASIVISFSASVTNPVLAWGGHIATRQAWGSANSAVSIPGSPYHTRLLDLDGSGGNQDRSLSADAVIFPAHVTVIKHADVPSATAFGFTATGLTPATFSLTDNSSSTDPQQGFGDIITFGSKSVAESTPLPGYKLTGITCTEDMTQNTTTSINSGGAGGSASIGLEEGENVTCTFTNTAQNPALTITKVATETGFSAVGDVIHYTITATNSGNTTLAAVTVTDTEVSDLSCTPANGSSLAPGASLSCTASHTITQTDIDAGSFYNQACVDDGTGGATQACDDVTTPGTQSPALTITKVATETGFSAVGDVIHYTITATNSGNTTLAAVTVTDTEVSDLSCTPANGSSLAPGASLSCTASHTITQTDIDAGSFYNQACVDDGTGGATQACDDVTTPGTQSETLSLTKTDNLNPAKYDHVGQVVTYTLTATNTGNVTLHSVTVSDSPALDGFSCTPTIPVASLAPGGTVVCTGTHTITQADLNAGSFADTGSASSTEATAPDANDTVFGAPSQTAQITPTATTCQQFAAGTSADLNSLTYGVKSNAINSVSPGVFFYYSKVTAPASSFTITVPESNLKSWKIIGVQQGQALLYDANCNKFDGTGTQGADGTVTYNVTGATTGAIYVVGIKYDPGTLVGQSVTKSGTPPKYPTNTYSYSTSVNGSDISSSHDSIDVIPR